MHTPSTLHDDGWVGTANRDSLPADPTTPARKSKLRSALAPLGGRGRVLDFGCGRGEFTSFIAGLGYETVGVDLSAAAVNLNRADFPKARFETVDADRPLPFPDASFDAIWSSEVIEHVYDVHGVMAEYARLLRAGGLLILTTPYHGLLKNLLLVTFAFDRHFNVEWQHIRFWTRRSLTKVAATHRLVPQCWDHVGRSWVLPKSFFVSFKKGSS